MRRSVVHSEETTQWPLQGAGCKHSGRSRQEMKIFLDWCRTSPEMTWGQYYLERESEKRTQTDKYMKDILACDGCHTRNRAGSKDTEEWDRARWLLKSGNNLDGSEEQCWMEREAAFYTEQAPRTKVGSCERASRAQETAGAWSYWNLTHEEWDGRDHKRTKRADGEGLCVSS